LDPTPELCYKLSSTKLRQLTQLVKNKYKSTSTLKKIFEPIKFLYIPSDGNYAKILNSRQLRQVVDNTMLKYSLKTLKYIFSPTKNLWTNSTKQSFTDKLHIYKILPNPA
jgi:hypothetical protein